MLRFAYIQILLSVLFIPMRADNRLDFFENRIRPVLVENCYECHNSIKQAKSGLVLDYKGGLLKGGDRGSVLSLENPKGSLILKVMGHQIRSLKMPKGGPKLSPEVIKDLSLGPFNIPELEDSEFFMVDLDTGEEIKDVGSFDELKENVEEKLPGVEMAFDEELIENKKEKVDEVSENVISKGLDLDLDLEFLNEDHEKSSEK